MMCCVLTQILCWKELYYGNMSEKEKQQLVSEVNILRELNHKYVVKYFDRVIGQADLAILTILSSCPFFSHLAAFSAYFLCTPSYCACSIRASTCVVV